MLRLRGVKFGELHSWDDLSLILVNQKVGLPPVKIYTVPIDGGDGELDLTEYFGGPQFGNRTLEFTFAVVDDIWGLSRTAQQALHGKKFRITLDDDPEFYYLGRVSVDDWSVIRRLNGTLEITCNCDPYKYTQAVTVISGTVPEDGELLLTCPNSRMRVIPEITTDAEIQVVYGATKVDVTAGTWRFTNLVFSEGENILNISGDPGTQITVRYQEGAI